MVFLYMGIGFLLGIACFGSITFWKDDRDKRRLLEDLYEVLARCQSGDLLGIRRKITRVIQAREKQD